MKQILILISSLLVLCSCGNSGSKSETSGKQAACDLSQFNWLLGEWKNITTEGVVGESWQKQNDVTFTGVGYFVKDGDTLSMEKLNLGCANDTLWYIPTVKNQNNGQPVKFQLRQMSANMLVFENQAHDFPQVVSYRFVAPDSLLAEISGMIKGERKVETFPMARVK